MLCGSRSPPDPSADHGVMGDAQALGQGVGGLEANAVHVQDLVIEVLLPPRNDLGAVSLGEAYGVGHIHAMAVQEDYDITDDLLHCPRGHHMDGVLGDDAIEAL
jgi:hypothetical protein